MRHAKITRGAAAAAASLLAGAAWADDQTPPPAAAPTAAAAAAPAAPTAPATPSMTGPLAADATPPTLDLGFLGKKVTINGAITGMVMAQGEPEPSHADNWVDATNAQLFINKSDGLIQYDVQVGLYSIPDIGVPYVSSTLNTKNGYGYAPQAFIKIAPSGAFSIEVGKLPTLVGAEYTFSIENMNVERGLLWNQEPAVSRGVQVNFTKGPLALSVSWNDGLYSNRYTWVSGAATWTFNAANVLEVVAAGNTQKTYVNTFATPILQNNEQIYNVIYTHTQGSFIIQPYFQYTHIPIIPGVTTLPVSTWGAALLINYTLPTKSWLNGFSLPFRFEYIHSSGTQTDGTPNVLYGPASKAWSFTVTPTYQYKIYFIRTEFSIVGATGQCEGCGFGPTGFAHYETRGLVETGVLF